jgi:hypothetical protein
MMPWKFMSGLNRNKTVEQALIQSAENLKRQCSEHCRLLCTTTSKGLVAGKRKKDICADCPYKHKFKETIASTIRKLENTRKSFKSKQIELLRKELTAILAQEI